MPSGIYERRPRKRFITHLKRSTPKATVRPRLRDIAWAAGLIEGEGTFGRTGGGGPCQTERIGVRQVDRECVDRLQQLFGGSVNPVDYSRNPLSRAKLLWHWGVYGSRARGVMMTLYTFFSRQRRQQIRRALQMEA